MKPLKNILLLTTLLLSTQAYATVYEDAEDESTNRWKVYDNRPRGASLDNVYVEDRDSNAIQFLGRGRRNGYILGNWEGRAGAWNNTTEHTLKWDMNFDESYTVYVRVMTKQGGRYIYYTPSNKSHGKRNSYIHIGLGKDSRNGIWQTITRDLNADLKKYEPSNTLIAVNAFLVRGNGLVDNVRLENLQAQNSISSIEASHNKASLHLKMNGSFIKGSHTSFFIDADDDVQTGYSNGSVKGAEYLVEDNSLYGYPDNAKGWQWDKISDDVETVFNSTAITSSIPLNMMDIGTDINYISGVTTADWKVNVKFTHMQKYTLNTDIVTFTPEQRLMANQIISVFENGTIELQYAYIKDIHDNRGYTAGVAGFTSGTGDMLVLIEKYTQIKPQNILSKYIPELKRLDKIYAQNDYKSSEKSANIENLKGLVEDWKIAAKDSVFRNLQDKVRSTLYFKPSLKIAQQYGIRYPLTLLCIYDAAVQHGVDGVVDDILKNIDVSSPKEGGDEITWLKAFNTQREDVISNFENEEKTYYRVHALNDIIEHKNYNFKPFILIMRDWGDESFIIPQKKSDNKWYSPKSNTTWHIQLSGNVNMNYDVDIYDIDLFGTTKKMISKLHQKDKKIICYFSAGSYEDWREDARDFPTDALGKKLDGWEGEKWLDIRNDALKSIMIKRIKLAKEKGCDGIDPDNVDGYTNNTGFNLTAKDQEKYNIFLATEAHKRGLAIGLKNDIDQIGSLVKYFDFAVNEECNKYNECSTLQSFIKKNKAILNIEYENTLSRAQKESNKLCQNDMAEKVEILVLPLDLDDHFRVSCQ